MNARHATSKDLTRLVMLGRELHSSSDAAWLPFSPATFRKSLQAMLRRPEMAVLVSEKDGELTGLLLGAIDQVLWGRALYATDLEFGAKAGGDELMEAFKAWATERGCKVLYMGVSNSGREKAKDKFFEKHGASRKGGLYEVRL